MATGRSSATAVGCLVLFALPFAAGGVFAGALALRQLASWLETRDWVETPARILEVELVTRSDSASTRYSVEARYEYEFRQRTYGGRRVWLESKPDSLGDFHRRVYEELDAHRRSGEAFRCFVDPDRPQDSILYRDLRRGLLSFKLFLALLFGGVGFGLLVAVPVTRRRLEREESLRSLYPEQPWRWRPQWEDGRIRSSAKSEVVLPCLFALFWNAVCVAVIATSWREILEQSWAIVAMATLFPLVGIGLLIWAGRAFIRWRKFGEAIFAMSRVPATPGGWIEGELELPKVLAGAERITSRLECERRAKGRDSDDSELLWQDERQDRGDELLFDGLAVRLPVSFEVPVDAETSTVDDEGDSSVTWWLSVEAETPGVDYRSRFEVPVLRGAGVSPALPEPSTPRTASAPPSLSELAALSRFRIETTPAGGTRLVFPAGRHLKAALSMTVLLLVWTAITVVLTRTEVPRLFPLAFSAIGLVLLYSFLDFWFGSRRLAIADRQLAVEKRLLGWRRQRLIPIEQIKGLSTDRGWQVGGKLFYRVLAKVSGGKRILVADRLESLTLARQLAHWLERELKAQR
jgi:hypothetical protein